MTERVFGWWVLARWAPTPSASSRSCRWRPRRRPGSSATVPIEVVRIEPPPEPRSPGAQGDGAALDREGAADRAGRLGLALAPLLQDVLRPEPTAPATESSVPRSAPARVGEPDAGRCRGDARRADRTGSPRPRPAPRPTARSGGANIASKDEGAPASPRSRGPSAATRPGSPGIPSGARREGIEGVTTLRFQVLASGRVGSVVVARSAVTPRARPLGDRGGEDVAF